MDTWLESHINHSGTPLFITDPQGIVLFGNVSIPLECQPVQDNQGEKEFAPHGIFKPFPYAGNTLWIGTPSSSTPSHRKYVSFISHELKTPLSILQSWSELLQRKLLSSPEELEEAYGILFSESQNLTQQLTRVIALIRLSSGQYPFSFQTITIEPSLHKVLSDLAMQAQKHGIIFERPERLAANSFWGDPAALALAFSAILENSLQHSVPGQSIEITTHADTQSLRLEFKDRGSGIPAELIPALFELYRIPDPRTRKPNSLGLGLPIAQRIVAAHQGRIEVESALGKGTTVRVILPLTSPPSPL